jgi:hypothetical protein
MTFYNHPGFLLKSYLIALALAALALLAFLHLLTPLNAFRNEEAFALEFAQDTRPFYLLAETAK